jgi:hypothetical protein
MEHDTKDSGRMTCSMGRVRRPGQTAPSMRGSTSQARSTVGEYTRGTMAHATRENGLRTRYAASELTLGLTEGSTKENGLITTWREWEFTHGKMVASMRDNIVTIRNTDMASIYGQICENIKACGTAGSSTG